MDRENHALLALPLSCSATLANCFASLGLRVLVYEMEELDERLSLTSKVPLPLCVLLTVNRYILSEVRV